MVEFYGKETAVEIYIEYVFIENFLYDFVLLWLAFLSARVKIRWYRLTASACVGGVFALVFPLLRLPMSLLTVLKLTIGALLCLLAFGKISTRKSRGRWLLTTVLFYVFSFGFGGALLVVYGALPNNEKIPSAWVFLGFAVLSIVSIWLVKCLYARRMLFRRVYACTVFAGEGHISTEGFYDSGNLAEKNGLPVCFLSPTLFYELLGTEIVKGRGQGFDEMSISTLAGVKKIPLYRGKIEVKLDGQTIVKDTYFSPSKHMIGREYAVLINGRLIEWEGVDAFD